MNQNPRLSGNMNYTADAFGLRLLPKPSGYGFYSSSLQNTGPYDGLNPSTQVQGNQNIPMNTSGMQINGFSHPTHQGFSTPQGSSSLFSSLQYPSLFPLETAPPKFRKARPATQPYQPGDITTLPSINNDYQYPVEFSGKENEYPDTTHNFHAIMNEILRTIREEKSAYGDLYTKGMTFWRFIPGNVWDLKDKPGIPPTDLRKEVSYTARYRGQLVQDNYFANAAAGQAAASLGIPLDELLNHAEDFTRATSPRFHFPSFQMTTHADQSEDQAAMMSGWFDYHTGNPWPIGLPSQKSYLLLRKNNASAWRNLAEHFQEDPAIHRLLNEARIVHRQRYPSPGRRY